MLANAPCRAAMELIVLVGPVIALRRGQDVVIRASKAVPGASTFLSASDVSGEWFR